MGRGHEQPDDVCANCTKDISHGTTGESGLYRPNSKGILLCEACFFEEDALMEEVGTNNIPERVAHHLGVLDRHRD